MDIFFILAIIVIIGIVVIATIRLNKSTDSFQVADSTGFAVGDCIELTVGDGERSISKITKIDRDSNTIWIKTTNAS